MTSSSRRHAFILVQLALAAVATIAVSAAQIAPGVEVTFADWMTPSNPPYPHDPEFAPDGSVWYTGQRANVIGRLDPATGQFKEFPLPTPKSGPHGLVADKDGNIWYTGNAAGLIGKVDAKTGQVTEYKMPDPAARDPHTPIFDSRGVLWFTVQGGNFIGMLEPKSGKVTLVNAPTLTRALRHQSQFQGVPFFDLFNTNKLGSIDPPR
jgi:virginiamycin B lyase